ncbi:hypothetical protein EDD21DRAFT_447352 [Dissophora ornata]|nr:hypothetical protein EDD21DRAFT_447352 [Dissophora ornata]
MNTMPFSNSRNPEVALDPMCGFKLCARKQLNNRKRIIEEVELLATQELEESESGKSCELTLRNLSEGRRMSKGKGKAKDKARMMLAALVQERILLEQLMTTTTTTMMMMMMMMTM